MSTLRMQIAEVKILIGQIRKDKVEAEEQAQFAAALAAGGHKALGANDEERKFALKQAVADSPAVKRYANDLLRAEAKLIRLEAELSEEQAAEQRDRWTIRARFVDALERVQFPAADSFFSGGEIDKAMDEVSDEVALAKSRRLPTPPQTSADRYRAENARRSTMAVDYPRGLSYDQIDHEADELFGDE